jgi:hypothetical protein
MPLILGSNSVSGYTVKNSLRFVSGDSLTRTVTASTATSYTVSFWIKINDIAWTSTPYLWSVGSTSGNGIYLDTSDKKIYYFKQSTSGFLNLYNGVLRDPSAWYHVVWSVNAGTGTGYINGITGNSHSSIPALNDNTGTKISIHDYVGGSYNGLQCQLSEYYFIDGSAKTPSDFGQTDTDTGIWIPKAYTGTYGTNGFYLEFQNSGALGTDSSGNGNTFTVNNLTSIDQTTDTPTNNFCTLNPLYKFTYSPTFSEGNLSFTGTQAQWQGAIGSLGISKGKWYYEAKFTSATAIADFFVGFGGLDDFDLSNPYRNNVSFYNSNGGEISVGDTANRFETTSDYGTFANGDIIGVALDYDNELISIYKNGSAIVTNYDYGATSYTSTLINGKTISPLVAHNGSGSISMNFGNPPYSGGSYTDSAGFGNFSYSVPSGFYALCTKNLSTQG